MPYIYFISMRSVLSVRDAWINGKPHKVSVFLGRGEGEEAETQFGQITFECACFFNQQVLFSVACGTLTPRNNQMLCGIPFTNFSSLSICSRNVSRCTGI